MYSARLLTAKLTAYMPTRREEFGPETRTSDAYVD